MIHFNPSYDIILETDTSDNVVAGIMNQKDTDGFYHSIAFYFKILNPTEMNYLIHDKELLIVILALKKWKADLQSIRLLFLIITDHRALEYFNEKCLLNIQQIDWIELLVCFHYKITYKSDIQNILMDTLSYKLKDLKIQKAIRETIRIIQLLSEDNIEESMMAPIEATMAEPTPEISETLETEATSQDYKMVNAILQTNCNSKDFPEATPFWTKILHSQNDWELIEGFLIKDGMLYIPPHDNWRIYLIDKVHSRLPTAYSDCNKTKKLL